MNNNTIRGTLIHTGRPNVPKAKLQKELQPKFEDFRGVTVAVINDGVDFSHPVLHEKMFVLDGAPQERPDDPKPPRSRRVASRSCVSSQA